MVISSITCKKQYILTHFFKIRHFLAIHAKRSVLVPIVKRQQMLLVGVSQ